MEVTGIGQEVISEFRLFEAGALNLGQSRIMHKPALGNWNQMISYCRTKIAEKDKEEFHVLILEKKNYIIADEMMGTGAVDHAPLIRMRLSNARLNRAHQTSFWCITTPAATPRPG